MAVVCWIYYEQKNIFLVQNLTKTLHLKEKKLVFILLFGCSKGQILSLNISSITNTHSHVTQKTWSFPFFSLFLLLLPVQAYKRRTCLCFVTTRLTSHCSSSSLSVVLLLLPKWLSLNMPLGWTINYYNNRPAISGALNKDEEKEYSTNRDKWYNSLVAQKWVNCSWRYFVRDLCLWMDDSMDGWINEWINGWMNGCMGESLLYFQTYAAFLVKRPGFSQTLYILQRCLQKRMLNNHNSTSTVWLRME